MPSDYIFVPCDQVHNPPMPPHGRIVDTSNSYDACDCTRGGHFIGCLDSAEALLEVLCMVGGCISEDRARQITREIRAHGVPDCIVPVGSDHALYLATRYAISQLPRWRNWAAKMAG